MDNSSIYADIAARTGGNIYIGVVGPVRTGKSTFIKRFRIFPMITCGSVRATSCRKADPAGRS